MPSNDRNWNLYFLAWTVSLFAMLGSLFFSEVLDYPPCVLCWYQRICMYPLVAIFLVRLFKNARDTLLFSIPLSVIGWMIALYHNLLYYKVLPEHATPCRQGISCTSVHIEWFGFITIPLLSLSAFSLILVITFILMRRKNQDEK